MAEASEPWWWSGLAARDSPLDPAQGSPCLAVVGSRRASDHGRAVSRRLGRAVAGAGGVTVSGLASGIDAEAHAGALEAGGLTLAVLGGGLGRPTFPATNRWLARRIVRQGALVSEYPMNTRVARSHFPRRNRIIAGLAAATVVVEAAARSGALITARLALEEGRDVFAVPGRWTDQTAAGSNGLLRAGVAGAIGREQDLFEDLAGVWRGLFRPPGHAGNAAAPPPGLTESERRVFRLLRTDEPTGVDMLICESGLPAQEALSALISLEIRSLVVAAAGGSYLRAV